MEIILKYTGIAGLALTILFLVFKGIIKKEIFPSLTKRQGYNILRLIILCVFILSLLSLAAYFMLSYNSSVLSADLIKADTSPNIVADKVVFNKGQIGTVIQGNLIQGPNEYTNIDDGEFEIFADENDGKEIFVNTVINDRKFDSSSLDSNKMFYNYPTYINELKTKFKTITDGGDYVSSSITALKFTVLHITDPKIANEIDKDGQAISYYYSEPMQGNALVTVIINEKNMGLINWNRRQIHIKGKFLVNFQIGGQGFNFITLSPV
ncbi:hypothetical protein [Chitinophaga sp. ARDCPP14]|uniref:hypothetical protein n=1 Tax=Chitinophaga sp. ARDCPP14 TaxID=3391139 RepID=UPI003F520537